MQIVQAGAWSAATDRRSRQSELNDDPGAVVLAQGAQPHHRPGVPVVHHRSEIVLIHLPVLGTEALGEALAQRNEIDLESLLARRRLQHPVDVQEYDPGWADAGFAPGRRFVRVYQQGARLSIGSCIV